MLLVPKLNNVQYHCRDTLYTRFPRNSTTRIKEMNMVTRIKYVFSLSTSRECWSAYFIELQWGSTPTYRRNHLTISEINYFVINGKPARAHVPTFFMQIVLAPRRLWNSIPSHTLVRRSHLYKNIHLDQRVTEITFLWIFLTSRTLW